VARRSSSRDDAAADLDLVALDPVTGAALATSDGDADVAHHRTARGRSRRRVAVLLAGLSLASGLAAGWFGLSIRDLRSIERTWRTAMALAAARQRADTSIHAVTRRDPDAARRPLGAVGDVESASYLRFERSLDERRVLDPKVSALRDEMVKALRFRRFQMTPERVRIGDTPLLRVDGELAHQLGRWNLGKTVVPPPVPDPFQQAVARLRDFSSEPTGGATLAAVTEAGRILTIDVDHSTVQRSPAGDHADPALPDERTTSLVPVPGGVAGMVGDTFTVLRPGEDGVARPVVRRRLLPHVRVLPAGQDRDGAAFWFVPPPGECCLERVDFHAADAALVDGGTIAGQPPDGLVVVGATRDELILTTDAGGGRLDRWNPVTGAITPLAPTGARFLAANDDLVVWQGPLEPSDTGNGGFLHVLHLTSGERDLVAIPHTDAASAAISPDGQTIAVAAGPLAGRLGSVLLLHAGTTALVGTAGPRVAVDGPAMSWSPDSHSLFWRTPDGELAVLHGTGQPRAELLRTGLEPVTAVVAFAR
jgi:hypothetical protein